jgi:hypothetical protein
MLTVKQEPLVEKPVSLIEWLAREVELSCEELSPGPLHLEIIVPGAPRISGGNDRVEPPTTLVIHLLMATKPESGIIISADVIRMPNLEERTRDWPTMLVYNEARDRDPVSAAHVGCEVVTKWCIRLEEWSFVLRKRQLIIVTALGRQSDGLRKSLCTCRTIAKDGQRRRRQKAHQKRPACLKHGFTLYLCVRRAPNPVHYTALVDRLSMRSRRLSHASCWAGGVDVPTLYRSAASSPARDDLAVEVEHAPSAVNAPASIARARGDERVAGDQRPDINRPAGALDLPFFRQQRPAIGDRHDVRALDISQRQASATHRRVRGIEICEGRLAPSRTGPYL